MKRPPPQWSTTASPASRRLSPTPGAQALAASPWCTSEAQGISCEIVPGVSSLFAAAAALGTQLTLGGVSDTLIVTRPAGKTLESDEIADLSRHTATMAFFLGADRIEEIVEKLRCPPDTRAAVVYHASWPDEVIIRGTLADIAGKAKDAGITRSALLIVGGVIDPERSGHRRSVLYS